MSKTVQTNAVCAVCGWHVNWPTHNPNNGDLYDHPFQMALPVDTPPEQPAREADDWRVEYDPQAGSAAQVVEKTIYGTVVRASTDDVATANRVVADHARAALVQWMIVEFQLLRDTAFAFHVDEKHKPEAFATCQHHVCLRACEVWNNVTAAARKAGVE